MKYYSDQELLSFMNRVPQSVRDVLDDMSTGLAIADIGQAHQLHIDQIGKLAMLDTYMLLGLISPPEFLQELIALGIAEPQARQIMAEINQKIFTPLHEKIRGESTVDSRQSTGEKSASSPVPAQTQSPLPSKLLSDHEEPHMEIAGSKQQTVNKPPSDLGALISKVAPQAIPKLIPPPPPNLPGASTPTPLPSPPVPKPVVPAKPLVKEYAADPYREPLDEK